MIKYAKVINDNGQCEVGLGINSEYYQSIGMTEQDVEKSDVDNLWYLVSKCPHKSEEQKQREEAERVGNLTCTKRVFILMLEELGVKYFEQILPVIEANRQAKLEWELCERLQRSNSLIDTLAAQFSITSEQLDNLFKYANGEISLEEFRLQSE